MPQTKAHYEVVTEFESMANKIIKKFPEVFGNIPIDKVRCVSIMNKNRSKGSKRLWAVKPVPDPIRLDCPYYYYIIFNHKEWAGLPESKQYLLIMDALQAIPIDQDQIDKGKVNSPDLSVYGIMVRTFGVDFMDHADIHPLNDSFEWHF